MLDSQMAERLSLLRARGGKIAAAYWVLRAILRIDTYRFYAIDLADYALDGEANLPEGYRFLRFENAEGIAGCDPTILEKIGNKSGRGVSSIVADGGRVYAIVCDTEVICQLNINFQRGRADRPLRMTLEFGEKDAFLSFRVHQSGFATGSMGISTDLASLLSAKPGGMVALHMSRAGNQCARNPPVPSGVAVGSQLLFCLPQPVVGC